MGQIGLVKIGMVGLGNVAQYQLAALSQLLGFEVVGACDIDPQNQKNIGNNIPFFTDLKDFLKSVEAHIILVSTPVDSHFEIAKDILESGQNVLLEKPATSNMDEFNELIEISRRNKTLLIVAFHAAFARDLMWFLESKDRFLKAGPVTGFRCAFYDSCLDENQELLPEAPSFKGSWFDSGINALSVIGRLVDVDSLKIEDVMLTRLPLYDCSEIQGTVHFVFSPEGSPKVGYGSIDTNWTLGLNYKATHINFSHTEREIVLYHSWQQVLLVNEKRESTLLADFSEDLPRLVNHYIGVFEDLRSQLETGRDNLDYAAKLHRLLFSAAESNRLAFLEKKQEIK